MPSRDEYMSIGETTTRLAQLELAQPERREHRRRRARARAAGANHRSTPATIAGVAQPQVARGQRRLRVSRLKANCCGLQVGCSGRRPRTTRGCPAAARCSRTRRSAVRSLLVGRERRGHVAGSGAERRRQRDRVLHARASCPSRSRSARCARRRRAARRSRGTRRALRTRDEADPRRAVGRSGGARRAARRTAPRRARCSHVALGRRRSQRGRAGAAPRLLVGLDDERATRVVEAVAVGLEDAVLGLDEEEREGVERRGRCRARCTSPRAVVERRAERAGVRGARTALLTPSAATTRSASPPSCAGVVAPRCWKRSATPSPSAAALEDGEQRLRASAEKPWPPEVMTAPR